MQAKPKLTTRRLAGGIAVSLVSLVLSGAVVGLVQAGGDAPAGFSLPAPRVGDRGEYQIHLDGTEETMQFSWLPAEAVRMGDGTEVGSHPLLVETQWADPEGEERTWWHKLHHAIPSGEPIAQEYLGGSGHASAGSSGLLFNQQQRSDAEAERLVFEPGRGFCGYRSDMQGQALEAGSSLRVRGACGAGADDEYRFRFAATEATDAGDALRFVREEAGNRSQLWFVSGVAYPVAIEHAFVVDAGGKEHEVTLRYELVGFEAGDARFASSHPTEDRPMPATQVAARTRLGPSDEGVDHPFPLREAWRVAVAEDEEFARYADEHPDAAVVIASYQEHADERSVQRMWFFQAADVEESITRFVTRETTTLADTPLGPVDVDQDQVTGGASQTQSRGTPHPNDLPERLPTVRSVIDKWAAYTGENATHGVGWSFWLHCLDPECQDVQGHVEGGQNVAMFAQTSWPPILAENREERHNLTSFAVDLEGAPQHFTRIWVHNSYQSGDPLAPPSGGADSAGEATQSLAPLAAGAWRLPDNDAAAGLGVAALLAGVAYWLWPLLKTGVTAPLFSRLHGHQVLEHPVRARLMERIEREPGVHYQAILREDGIGKGALEHHLRKLEEAGLVVAQRGSGYTCFFAKGGTDRRVMAAAPLLKSPSSRRVLQAIAAAPGRSAIQVAHDVGLQPATVNHHLKRLRGAGLIETERNGRMLAVSLTRDGKAALGPAAG